MVLYFDSINDLPEQHREQAMAVMAPRSGNTAPKSRNKYNATKTMYKGVLFDSRKEARYAEQLDLEMKGGTVQWWCYHPQFLLPGNVIYEADFIVCHYLPMLLDGIEIIDVKSKATKTASYRIKKKLLKEQYGIEIKEI